MIISRFYPHHHHIHNLCKRAFICVQYCVFANISSKIHGDSGNVEYSNMYICFGIQCFTKCFGQIVFYRVKGSCSGPPEGVLGTTPASNFHICSRKCLQVLGYHTNISQFLLFSQPETVISALTISMI